MSGRGRNSPRRPGRNGGRGSDSRSNNSKPRKTETKKSLSDYNYYLGSSKQASDYESTTEFIINHIKKTFDRGQDIATALKDLKPVDDALWKPSLQVSIEQDKDKREAENRQYDIEFTAKFELYTKRKATYDNNLVKAYALIWERCTKGMKNKIEARRDFESVIEDNPIELLKAIKEHALSYQENKYAMSIVLDALRTYLGTKQKEGESLQDYTKRFRVAKDVFESQIGSPLILTKVVKSLPEFASADTDEKQERLISRVSEQFAAYLYLDNADKAKYGSIMAGLNTQQSLGNNQYPKTITESNNVLSNHPFDNGNNKLSKNKDKNQPNKSEEKKDAPEEELSLSFAQMEGKCYCCGKAGHKSPTCRDKNKPKEEWAINKAQQSHAQMQSTAPSTSQENRGGSSETGNTANSNTGWAGTHINLQFYQAHEMREWILLDNESTITIFCNPKLVTDIHDVDEVMRLYTNGGVLSTKQKAHLPGWGEVWFNPDAITNIFSYAEMASRHRITYDSLVEDAFVVHLPDKQVKFTKSETGLYIFKPKINKTESQFVTTVQENRAFYTPRQFERAKKARDLYHAIGTPSVDDFKAILRMNLIKDNPITTQDIDMAENIFGPDIGALKGKVTRTKPVPVVDNRVELPPELHKAQKNVTLCIDTMTVNGLQFLTTISLNLFYRTAQHIARPTMAVYKDALAAVFRVYRLGGFKVTHLRCDNEYKPLMDSLANDFHIAVNYANPQEHVPEAERNNRVIKERVRATFHRLPFHRIPRILLKALVSEAAKKLNFFPAKNGISTYYSPRMILHQRVLEYNKHCKYSLGTYVQAHDEPIPSNTNAPRTLDCLYLRYHDNLQGGHELLHLQTNKTIIRRTVTPIPITDNIIKQVHELASLERMPPGLKISNRTGTLLYDSAWIAGVDYHERNSQNEDNEENEEETNGDETNHDNENNHDEMDPDDIQGLGETNNEHYSDEGDDYEIINQDDLNENISTGSYDNIEEHSVATHNEGSEDNAGDIEDNENTNNEVDNEQQDEEQDANPSTAAEHMESTDKVRTTRSGRVVRPPDKLSMLQAHDNGQEIEYSQETAKVIAMTMCIMNERGINIQVKKEGSQFIQTYSLNKGLKHFGQQGKQAAMDELKQLHQRIVFEPVQVSDLTEQEIQRALESLMFLVEKRDGRIKGRTCANGSTQREYVEREDAASPTASTDSIFITAGIDAKEERDVMTADIPNAFVQTDVERKEKGERIIMKIRGAMVDMLLELAPEVYQKYVVYEGSEKVLYVIMMKALYGMLQSSLLYYKKFRKDIEGIGFKINPYDPCVANRMVNGSQHTVTWHVDDLKSSHIDKAVNDEFLEWLKAMYASDGIGEVKAVRGKRHDYLAMVLDFTLPGVLRIDMTEYVKSMVQDFPENLSGKETCPWNDNLFKVNINTGKLDKQRAQLFHTFVMKGMFLCKRGRHDILPGIAFLATRVTDPNNGDWIKLKKLLNFLKATQDEVMTIRIDDSHTIKWYVDAAFAVHKDMKSHTGACMTLGYGMLISMCTKQKVNSRSSTEAELVGIDDVVSKILWTKRFLQAQGYTIKANIVYRDNQSSMKLEANGTASSGKRTRHFEIKYYYITDLIQRNEIQIEFCPTDVMIADYMTKPLVGAKFTFFRNKIMG